MAKRGRPSKSITTGSLDQPVISHTQEFSFDDLDNLRTENEQLKTKLAGLSFSEMDFLRNENDNLRVKIKELEDNIIRLRRKLKNG